MSLHRLMVFISPEVGDYKFDGECIMESPEQGDYKFDGECIMESPEQVTITRRG